MTDSRNRRLDKIARMVSPGIDPKTIADVDRELLRTIREAETNGTDWRGVIRGISGGEPYTETFIAEMEQAIGAGP